MILIPKQAHTFLPSFYLLPQLFHSSVDAIDCMYISCPLTQKGDAYVQRHKNIITREHLQHSEKWILLLPVPSFNFALSFKLFSVTFFSLKSASKIPVRWQLVKQGHLSHSTGLGEHVSLFLSGTQWRSQSCLQTQVQELKPQLLISLFPSKLLVDIEVLSATALSPGKGRLSQMAYLCHMKGGFQLGCSFFLVCVLMLLGLENSQEMNDRHTSDLQLHSKLSSINTISHQSVQVQAECFVRQHLMAKEASPSGPFIKK